MHLQFVLVAMEINSGFGYQYKDVSSLYSILTI